MSEAENQELTFAKRLKAETTGVHDSVDNLVMSVCLFSRFQVKKTTSNF